MDFPPVKFIAEVCYKKEIIAIDREIIFSGINY
jgi:hypothetical protein